MLSLFPTFRRPLPLGRYETAASLLARHAAQLGIPGAAVICSDLGVRWSRILSGDRTLLASLATAAQVPFDDLARWSPVRTRDGFFVGHETVPASAWSRRHARFCPHCLREDLAEPSSRPDLVVFGRSHWHFQCLPVCKIHRVALIEPNSVLADQTNTDFTLWIRPILRDFGTWVRQTVPCTPSDCDAYLLDRLRGDARAIPLLDGLPLPLVTRACEELGTGLITEQKDNLQGETVHTIQKARHRGFQVFAGGSVELSAYFSDRLEMVASDKRSGKKLTLLYGGFCAWLIGQSAPSLDPIRDVFADHVFANIPLPAGSTVCGRTLKERRRHTIHSAATEFGSRKSMMRTWLLAEKILPEPASQYVDAAMIPATPAAAAFVDKVRDAITYKQAGRYLKINLVQFDQLISDGIVCPIFPRSIINAKNAYSRTELQSFLLRLVEGRANEKIPFDVSIVCKRATEISPLVHCDFVDIIRLLLSKEKIRIFIEPNVVGVDAIHLWIEDIKKCIGSADFPGITPSAFASRLQINLQHLKKLKEAGLIWTERMQHPKSNYAVDIIPNDCVLQFEEKYISLEKLASISRRHWIAQFRYLNSRRCYPIYDGSSPKSRIYRFDPHIMSFPNLSR